MSGLDLIVFLQQRIAEDKRAAERLAAQGVGLVLGGLWAAAIDANTAAQAHDAANDRYLKTQQHHLDQVKKMLAIGDPERALREAEAKESLLERYINSTQLHLTAYETTFTGAHHATLEDTLVAAAAIYRDHPDHQEDWFEDEDED